MSNHRGIFHRAWQTFVKSSIVDILILFQKNRKMLSSTPRYFSFLLLTASAADEVGRLTRAAADSERDVKRLAALELAAENERASWLRQVAAAQAERAAALERASVHAAIADEERAKAAARAADAEAERARVRAECETLMVARVDDARQRVLSEWQADKAESSARFESEQRETQQLHEHASASAAEQIALLISQQQHEAAQYAAASATAPKALHDLQLEFESQTKLLRASEAALASERERHARECADLRQQHDHEIESMRAELLTLQHQLQTSTQDSKHDAIDADTHNQLSQRDEISSAAAIASAVARAVDRTATAWRVCVLGREQIVRRLRGELRACRQRLEEMELEAAIKAEADAALIASAAPHAMTAGATIELVTPASAAATASSVATSAATAAITDANFIVCGSCPCCLIRRAMDSSNSLTSNDGDKSSTKVGVKANGRIATSEPARDSELPVQVQAPIPASVVSAPVAISCASRTLTAAARLSLCIVLLCVLLLLSALLFPLPRLVFT
jgi:hypothetical protein